MQNQNPWSWGQGSGLPFAGGQPVLPTTFPSPGVDQNPLLPGYNHMYGNSPAQPPPDYGQWTAAQMQQWQQWQQWQEKYQQWQAQYGKKYAESLAALGQSSNVLVPGMPPVLGLSKPGKLGLASSMSPDPPLPANSQPVPPPPPEEEKPPLPAPSGKDGSEGFKNGCVGTRDNPEELSEAEKTFDIQFKQWEGQFNAWKKENQDHPDKAQYKEYEKKWEAWREQLLQRREQMRKKRLGQVVEHATEGSNPDKSEDSKTVPGLNLVKSDDVEYSYRSQPPPVPQTPFPADFLKFENKQVFDKPPPMNPVLAPLFNFNQRGNIESKKNLTVSSQSPFSCIDFSGFGGIPDKTEPNRQLLFMSNQNMSRNFEGTQQKTPAQGPNFRFGNFEIEKNGGSPGSRFRNPNAMDGPRFGAGKLDVFSSRQRYGNGEERSSGSFGSPQRFPSDKHDTFRNERDFSQQRFFESNRERELGGHHIFGKGSAEVFGRANEGSCLPDNSSFKPKVPSLFDITVEKPPGLMDSSSKVWEKEEYFEGRGKEREGERNERAWGNNDSRGRNLGSPWMQPWELEKMACQKVQETRVRDRGGPGGAHKDIGPWIKEISGKQEMDKIELSGYVGNILAKLGHFNVTPQNPGNEVREEGITQFGTERINGGTSDSSIDEGNAKVRNAGFNQRTKDEPNGSSISLSGNGGNVRNLGRNASVPSGSDRFEQNFAGSESQGSRESQGGGSKESKDGFSMPRNHDRFGESGPLPFADSDERLRFKTGDKSSEPEERVVAREDRPSFRREERIFGKDDSRNLGRSTARDERRNFVSEDRFFGRDDLRGFLRSGRDERSFGRFDPRDDVDERFGPNRIARRNFDRFDRDEKDGRGFPERQGGRGSDNPFDRFGRPCDHSLNEPVWKPQVFDYSQGRPLRLPDPDEGFKISTIVDYSHGENKQTFDYGHGERSNERTEIKSFEYVLRTEVPTIIDYGHGVDKDPVSKDSRKDRSKESEIDVEGKMKVNAGSQFLLKSRSPKARFRSRSRSPHSKYKRASVSPPFKNDRSRSRDGSGRQMMRRNRRSSDEKLSPGDSDVSKHSFDVTTVLVEDLICLPGRETRPTKVVFIMRGIPGSGKTYVTKLIKDKEIELGGDPPRILSLDDYFMTEVEKEIIDEETGRKVKSKLLEYEYEAAAEPHYRGSLVKALKKTISDGFFSFVIVDSVNEKTKDYEEMWSFAKQKGFQVYIAEMDNDVAVCTGRNIHKRTEKEISDLVTAWEETPPHYLRLDVRSLLQSDAIAEVEMEVVSDTELEKAVGKEETERGGDTDHEADDGSDAAEKKEDEEEDEPGVSTFVKSRWDQFENSEQNLDRLDGLKRRREGFHATMKDYLQLPDDLDEQTSDSVPGKKRVRWADLEERRQQEKMRAIGFVVGQTDWSRMTDPTFGESALTRTKDEAEKLKYHKCRRSIRNLVITG